MSTLLSEPVTVRAPASSANLGPGFDACGLALDVYDEVTARVTGDAAGVRVEVAGEGAGALPADERHLVVRSLYAGLDALGVRPPGLAVRCRNAIPQARGMGSSSAAIVAGLVLARALVAGGARRWPDAALLRLASEIEGHPDNVAACLLGGLTIAWTEADGARAVRLTPHPELQPVVYVPTGQGLTAHARAALPAAVPHRDAAFAAGRAALLVHALTERPELAFAATEDRLHQPYRAAGMPDTAALVGRLRAAGVAAVVSGAGPSVLALSPVPPAAEPGPEWKRLECAVAAGAAPVPDSAG
ncbi:homoserine kinase [Pilimelia anulata]|uniref:Homoserine kinase n=1 Tax=Pilimelia anulata TaxID=53371 RepID=A0A8J3F6U9_9ACTN|nr:homoserine kinase [Pilimelia anulata]GGJ83312.1 homoserine kinase [Pilimelia anulata]